MGLPLYGQRRTPGLRREEVAHLAHIGTSWYTALEQGRVSNPSDQVLDSLAGALRLSAEERRHLRMLARPAERGPIRASQEVTLGLERTIFALDPSPALALSNRWDLLLWNKAAELVFGLPTGPEEELRKPNWLRRFLADPEVRRNNPDWEAKAQVLIARFRADYAYFQQDAGFNELIEELWQTSEAFRENWPKHDVQVAADCHKRWTSPLIGEMEFEYVTLQQPDHPAIKLVIYAASPTTALRLKELLGFS